MACVCVCVLLCQHQQSRGWMMQTSYLSSFQHSAPDYHSYCANSFVFRILWGQWTKFNTFLFFFKNFSEKKSFCVNSLLIVGCLWYLGWKARSTYNLPFGLAYGRETWPVFTSVLDYPLPLAKFSYFPAPEGYPLSWVKKLDFFRYSRNVRHRYRQGRIARLISILSRDIADLGAETVLSPDRYQFKRGDEENAGGGVFDEGSVYENIFISYRSEK